MRCGPAFYPTGNSFGHMLLDIKLNRQIASLAEVIGGEIAG
jgi:hypothetical protein